MRGLLVGLLVGAIVLLSLMLFLTAAWFVAGQPENPDGVYGIATILYLSGLVGLLFA